MLHPQLHPRAHDRAPQGSPGVVSRDASALRAARCLMRLHRFRTALSASSWPRDRALPEAGQGEVVPPPAS